MEIAKITVESRTARGRNQVARLREQGKVPAVLYGRGVDALHLTVDEREVQRHVRQHHKVFKLSMDGVEQSIFLHDVQWDCLTDRPLHVDFLRIDLSEPLNVTVELTYLGHPIGVSKGSHLVKDLMDLKVRALPEAIPETIEIRVSNLDMGEAILAGDLQLPEGVELDLPADTSICHMPGEAELAAEAARAQAAEEAAAAAAAGEGEEAPEPAEAPAPTPEDEGPGES